jgi:CubicO group peptidase (beta-lactamase class C family)
MGETDIPIGGTCDPVFAAVEEVFRENFDSRHEIGAGVCVYKDGEKVVDLWGGHRDASRTEPWEENTIVLMNSVVKSICALAVHVLADQGRVDLDAPVADYWPEFGQNGKEGILVRHVQAHECGAIFSDSAMPGDWFDYPAQCAAIAAQPPAFPAGTKGAYNTINIGFILGEVVRKVTGETIGTFIREEISEPLGAEYNLGLTPDEAALCATMHTNPENKFWSAGAQSGSNLHRAWSGRPDRDDLLNCEEIREGELPAFGGHGNARGAAKIYAMLAGNGEVDGVRILKPETVERAAQFVWEGICYMTEWPLRMGLGFEQNSPPYIAMGENMKAFGKLGSGGALAFCDRERNLAFSYCTNFQCEGAGTGIRCRLLGEAAAGVAPEWTAAGPA